MARVNRLATPIDMIAAGISAATAIVAYAMPALQAGNRSWKIIGVMVL
jgi:hypothetical protein